MNDEDWICGSYRKDIPTGTPIVLDGELIGEATAAGDDVVCLTHLREHWGVTVDVDDVGTSEEAKLVAEGFTVTRRDHCTLPWDETNPPLNVGAVIMAFEEPVGNDQLHAAFAANVERARDEGRHVELAHINVESDFNFQPQVTQLGASNVFIHVWRGADGLVHVVLVQVTT